MTFLKNTKRSLRIYSANAISKNLKSMKLEVQNINYLSLKKDKLYLDERSKIGKISYCLSAV